MKKSKENRIQEYCYKLYNYTIIPNCNKLINRNNNTANEDPLTIIECEVENVINIAKRW